MLGFLEPVSKGEWSLVDHEVNLGSEQRHTRKWRRYLTGHDLCFPILLAVIFTLLGIIASYSYKDTYISDYQDGRFLVVLWCVYFPLGLLNILLSPSIPIGFSIIGLAMIGFFLGMILKRLWKSSEGRVLLLVLVLFNSGGCCITWALLSPDF